LPLTLYSNTCLVLGSAGKIQSYSGSTTTLAVSASSVSHLSISGGIINGILTPSTVTMAGISIDLSSVVLIDGVTVKNFSSSSAYTSGATAIHLNRGGASQIVHGCTVNNCGDRGIWTQNNTGRFIIADNSVTGCNHYLIDFDSFTNSSLIYGNTATNCTADAAIFVEEGAQLNKVIDNDCEVSTVGVALNAQVVGQTDYNSIICNICENNSVSGIRNGAVASSGLECSHNYFFNNVLANNTADIVSLNVGSQNYHSQNCDNTLSGGPTLTLVGTTSVFFNPD
jgi:hypothetical protein